MDPFVQSSVALLIGLAFFGFGVAVIVPFADRIADRWERRQRARHLPPAE